MYVNLCYNNHYISARFLFNRCLERKIQGLLKKWHVIIFYLGLLFDSIGTTLMSKIAQGGFQLNIHGITGALAIILMFFHAFWATIVLIKNDLKAKVKFHKFSLIVWIIWLIPFVTGAILGMKR